MLVNYIIITKKKKTKNAELSRLYHSWNNGEGTRSTAETLSTSFVNRNIYERIYELAFKSPGFEKRKKG